VLLRRVEQDLAMRLSKRIRRAPRFVYNTSRVVPSNRHAPFDAAPCGCYDSYAGWSSLVARWAHNPKVGGSNPPPATNLFSQLPPSDYKPPLTLRSHCQQLPNNLPVRGPFLIAYGLGVHVHGRGDVGVP
jgi:hypothetical protein